MMYQPYNASHSGSCKVACKAASTVEETLRATPEAAHVVTSSWCKAAGSRHHAHHVRGSQLSNLPPHGLHISFKLVAVLHKRDHYWHQIRCDNALQARLLVYSAPYHKPVGRSHCQLRRMDPPVARMLQRPLGTKITTTAQRSTSHSRR